MAFNIVDYQQKIADVDAATTNNEKGATFETLCEYLFNCLNGVQVHEKDIDMPSEEIDLVLWNAQLEEELKPFDMVTLVECKNWNVAVGASVLDNFIGKLRRRALKTGIFIAANGVTGAFSRGEDGAKGIISHALQEGIKVITIRMDDLRAINTIDDFKALIKRRFCGIFVYKILA